MSFYTNPRELADSADNRIAAVLNIILLAGLILASHEIAMANGFEGVVLGLGAIGMWRHTWGLTNFVRAYVYSSSRSTNIPKLPTSRYNLTVILPVYSQTDDEVRLVARGLRDGVTTTTDRVLVVCAHKTAEQRKIIQAELGVVGGLSLAFVPQIGLGKREAMADALSLAATVMPKSESDFVLLMDGDTLVTIRAIVASVAELQSDASLGAVCVNETPIVQGSPTFTMWRWLRSLQRNHIMSAFSASDRVLVLTGRFSMYRADFLLAPEVINRIRKDHLTHEAKFIPLLTGDDKTTWLELLRRGKNLRYLPEVEVYPIERQSSDCSFFRETLALTTRYSGNMARANLHPDAWRGAKGKTHFRYGLLDQRISMWTSLLTPAALALSLLSMRFDLFILIMTYALLIKNLQAVALYMTSGSYSATFPYLIFYNQLMMSLVKISTFAFLHRQRWTHQNIALSGGPMASLDRSARTKIAMQGSIFALFVLNIYFYTLG
jgi:glycosyltransferase Alg8